MKKNILIVLILLSLFTGIVYAEDDDAIGQVSVTGVDIDPPVLMTGDTATVKIEITNTGPEGVGISRARLYSNDFEILEDNTYNTVGTVGSKNKMEFTFTIRAKSGEGIYYPRFYLDLSQAGSLNYRIPVKVEDSGLSVSVVDMPDSFPEGKKVSVKLMVGNPRENTVNGVMVIPFGDCFDSTQTGHFIGKLDPDQSAEVTFDIIPVRSGNISFDVEYRNGMNKHNTDLTLPVKLGEGKKSADLVINNIDVSRSDSGYRITGDITNVGLEDAKSVVVTAGEPATPGGSFPVYVVGSLQPDDFSSFEITFDAENQETIPVLAKLKDADGNVFTKSCYIDLPTSWTNDKRSEQASSDAGFPWLMVVLLLAVLGGVYAWKKGMFSRLKNNK